METSRHSFLKLSTRKLVQQHEKFLLLLSCLQPLCELNQCWLASLHQTASLIDKLDWDCIPLHKLSPEHYPVTISGDELTITIRPFHFFPVTCVCTSHVTLPG